MANGVKYFYDTEFLEDGYTIDLISIGIVSEDGREYYAVSSEFDTRRVARDSWLMDNVMSSIDYESKIAYMAHNTMPIRDLIITDPAVKTRLEIRNDILEFVQGTWPEFWAWYGAYDHVALCQLFGRMIELPNKFPMFTHNIKHLAKQAGNPELPVQPDGNHNALEDAKWNVVRYNYLQGYLNAES